jgi:outer membrane protein TolC
MKRNYGRSEWGSSVPVILFLFIVTLCGCVHYQPKPLSPVRNLDSFEQRSLADPGLKTYLETNGLIAEWPMGVWDFKALTLAAFYFHPDLDVARARWAAVQAGIKTAGERPNPTINVAPAYNTTTATPSPWLVTATLDIPIETAGKRGYRLAQAEHLTEAARLNIASVAWQVRSRLRKAIIDLYTAQETQALLGAQQLLQVETVRLLDLQQREGAVSAFELTQARIAADSARLLLRDAERQYVESRAEVADAVGIPLSALKAIEISFAGMADLPTEMPTQAARRQALLNRPDILSALQEYDASQAALQLEIAKQYPDIHLNPGYEFDQGDNKWSPGLTITLPVLNQNKGPIAEAEARRAEAQLNFNALQAHVVGEIDRAVGAYQASIQKTQDANAIEQDLNKQEKTAQGMLEAGEISRSELTALRLQLSTSALARLDAIAKSQAAFQQLEDALQSPAGLPESLWQYSSRGLQTKP